MIPVSSNFNNLAAGTIRPIAFNVSIAFAKEFDDSVDFFTIGTSAIGGTDVLKGTGDVVQEWDKYLYFDYTPKVLNVEWDRSTDPYSSVSLAMADVTLDNTDSYFSADNFALPYRPIRIYAGFDKELVQVFVGLTEKAPVVSEDGSQVTFHCIDFLSFLFDQTIDEVGIFIEQRTDQILAVLLEQAGLLVGQYDLDEGINIIPFAYFDRDTKLGDAIQQLMVAEQGRFYLSEAGVVTFRTRQSYNTATQWDFDRSNTLTYDEDREDNIVNSVLVKSNVRAVQGTQNVGQMLQATLIAPGDIAEIWIDFQDPVTTIDSPQAYSIASTSYYLANTIADGTGDDVTANILLVDDTLFSTAYLAHFQNLGSDPLYLTNVTMFGTPARVVNIVNVTETDDASIAKYDIRPKEIDNDFIQSIADAQTKGLTLLHDYANYDNGITLDVKGNMALQLGDYIQVQVKLTTYVFETGDTFAGIAAAYGVTTDYLLALNPGLDPAHLQPDDIIYIGILADDYLIDKITCQISDRFRQVLHGVKKTYTPLFTIGVSQIGGTDELSP